MDIKLENKDAFCVLFGLPILGACILMLAVWLGHLISRQIPLPPVALMSAVPKIDIVVPPIPAPRVEVTAVAAPPAIEVNVPPSNPAAVNITAPQPLVTVIDRRDTETKKEIPPRLEAPRPSNSEVTPTKVDLVQIAFSKSEPITFKAEDLTLDTLYQYAEKYIESYCTKNHLDPRAEEARWNKEWRQRLETAISDGTSSDEQQFMNRVIVDKRDCLDLERATPEKIVEGCRLMLRYRDGKLQPLQALKDQITGENLRKSLVFLAAGVK